MCLDAFAYTYILQYRSLSVISTGVQHSIVRWHLVIGQSTAGSLVHSLIHFLIQQTFTEQVLCVMPCVKHRQACSPPVFMELTRSNRGTSLDPLFPLGAPSLQIVLKDNSITLSTYMLFEFINVSLVFLILTVVSTCTANFHILSKGFFYLLLRFYLITFFPSFRSFTLFSSSSSFF